MKIWGVFQRVAYICGIPFLIGCLVSNAALATSIVNNFGLVSPVETITFDEFVFAALTPITNQYASLGVTFTTGIKYDPQLSCSDPETAGFTFPNISGHCLGNFEPITNPFSIIFANPITEAAFAVITTPGTSTFIARLDGSTVEAFSAATDNDLTSSENFFGFTEIVFDEIHVSVGGSNNAMLLDNLQTGLPIPEPSTALLLVTGLAAMAVGRWRHVR